MLEKQRVLQKRGWPKSALLITVVKDTNNAGHAVLTVRTDQGDIILREKRLQDLDLSGLEPPLSLEVIDIDGAGIDPELRARYDLEVPVLALQGTPLPRVSPRLSGEGLFIWLQRLCTTIAGSD